MQNQYYLAKQNMEDEPDEAIKGFKKVLELESEIGEKGDWYVWIRILIRNSTQLCYI